jgi:c-di-GMP-binding flagellar brake protein YcgR
MSIEWDGLNRRRFIRTKHPFTIHIYSQQEEAISTYTEDISEGGVKISIREQLPIARVVNLEIYLEAKPIICKGKIIWTGTRKSDYLESAVFFDTGIEFSELGENERIVIRNRVEELEKERKSKEEKK